MIREMTQICRVAMKCYKSWNKRCKLISLYCRMHGEKCKVLSNNSKINFHPAKSSLPEIS